MIRLRYMINKNYHKVTEKLTKSNETFDNLDYARNTCMFSLNANNIQERVNYLQEKAENVR